MADSDPLVAISVRVCTELATTRQGRDYLSQWYVGISVGFFTETTIPYVIPRPVTYTYFELNLIIVFLTLSNLSLHIRVGRFIYIFVCQTFVYCTGWLVNNGRVFWYLVKKVTFQVYTYVQWRTLYKSLYRRYQKIRSCLTDHPVFYAFLHLRTEADFLRSSDPGRGGDH